jgi:hypothetical protein
MTFRAGLLAACEDEQLLGVLGVPLTPDQRLRLAAVEAGPRTHVWAVGRRGLKTTTAALVGLWCCLLRPELLTYLRPGERGYCVGIATNHRQARLLVQAALSIVERSPLLAPPTAQGARGEDREGRGRGERDRVAMPSYTIILERRDHGSACGSTNDVIDAESEAEAIEQAIAAWRKVEPRFTFAPLFSAPVLNKRLRAST